jgi:hypothetical protein
MAAMIVFMCTFPVKSPRHAMPHANSLPVARRAR